MIEYTHIRIGEDRERPGDISVELLKRKYEEYPQPYRISIPSDGYINKVYRRLDDNLLQALEEIGKVIYWANPYNPRLRTHTTFMIFYIENDTIIPLFIVLPPEDTLYGRNGSTPYSGYDTGKMTNKQRKLMKLRKKLGILPTY